MSLPRATMRLQFHRGFTFDAGAALVPYLASLGISHLYASPIMTARPGSLHGYDVIDATRVNDELGGEYGFRELVRTLRRHELGLIVDIVPNHMAIGSGNAWWMDVLAHGRHSRYANFFDIDWSPPSPQLQGKILLPVLGRPYGEALDAGEIGLGCDGGGQPFISYFDHRFPVATGADAPGAPSLDDIDASLPIGRQRLHELLEAQHYRLAWWRSANDEINWRRFFDINELAALRVEDDDVFEATHATVFRLYREGLIDGLRVDHIDGLSEPGHYCRKLRQRLQTLERERPRDAPPGAAYLVVEKILAGDESLPADWQVDGTTGYDFMDQVNALLHDARGEQPLGRLWQRISGRSRRFAEEEELARRETLKRSFSAQQQAAVESLYAIAASDLATRDYARAALDRCLTEILAHFPVYRIYARVGRHSQSDLDFLSRAVDAARATALPSDRWLLDVLREWLAGKPVSRPSDAIQQIALNRFQQLSAPLCAKAVEDTAFYRYGRLISRNDVGFDADRFASSPSEFHAQMQSRAAIYQHAMLATATHDHKRGEDVRSRLAVLSELADDWPATVERWLRASAPGCTAAGAATMPSDGDRAILFQTVVGAWPLQLNHDDRAGLARFAERVAAWQQKALREAKLHSDWSAPNDAYETAAKTFIDWLFSRCPDLLAEIEAFATRIGPAGALNGLAQALIKLTAPGVPDIYQGTEYWDLSLVDPDNRAPVDFAARSASLDAGTPADLVKAWRDGRIKQSLIARVLAARKESPELFADGLYQALKIEGPLAEHMLAFARVLGDTAAITAVCLHPLRLLADDGSLGIPPERLKGSRLILPAELRSVNFSDVLNKRAQLPAARAIGLEQILAALPVAFLIGRGA